MTTSVMDHRMTPAGDCSAVYVDYKLSSTMEQEDEAGVDKRLNARRLSVSRSGRCKNRTQLRVKLPSEDQYRSLDTRTSPALGDSNPSHNRISSTVDVGQGTKLSINFTPPSANVFRQPGSPEYYTASTQAIRNQITDTSPSVDVHSGSRGGAGSRDKMVIAPALVSVTKTDVKQLSTSSMGSDENNAVTSPLSSPAYATLTIFNESADGENIESTAF